MAALLPSACLPSGIADHVVPSVTKQQPPPRLRRTGYVDPATHACVSALASLCVGVAGSKRSLLRFSRRRFVAVAASKSKSTSDKLAVPPPPDGFDTKRQVLPIVKYPHPALRAENALVTDFDDRLRQLAENMFLSMYETNDGVGLAAPQVGVNQRVLVYNPKAMESWNPFRGQEEKVFVNAKITLESDEKDRSVESCLSFPGMDGSVKRHIWVSVEAQDLDGNSFRRRLTEFEARLFQHEYDHLDGVNYVDRLGPKARARVQPDLDLLVEQYDGSPAL